MTKRQGITFMENSIMFGFMRRCPDFPGGDLVADAMIKGLKRRRLTFSVKNLASQWRQLKRQPRFRKLANVKFARQERILRRFEQMTQKQQERFLRSKEYKRFRLNQ